MTKSVDTQDISSAADQLRDTIALKLGDLADQIMDRPESGSAEWIAEHQARKNNEGWAVRNTRDWHLTKIAIAVEARLDPTGDVLNAKQYGATWQAIADQCGITRQAAYDRWQKAGLGERGSV